LYPFFFKSTIMNTENKISVLSKVLLVIAALCLASNMVLPIWRIDLFAPQYPEGLMLLIYADKLGGNVEIINGLNHYIGMQTLHAENFIEFTILKYILGFFSGFILLTAIIGRKKLVYVLFASFLAFSLLAMADFYRWNYNYGHNLDPNAAIKVPGMSYQPPLIGYKQLLNFGAYSMPDTGGMLFIGTGILILLVILIERNVFSKWLKRKQVSAAAMLFLGLFTFAACGTPGPRAIKLNQDACAFCKMTITELPFATQLTTIKGRQYIFDDLTCMVSYKKENTAVEVEHFYVADFCNPSTFVDIDQAMLLQSDSLRSPMGGNMAAFAVRDSAMLYKTRYNASEVSWAELIR
jgi:copper chaperone NosL